MFPICASVISRSCLISSSFLYDTDSRSSPSLSLSHTHTQIDNQSAYHFKTSLSFYPLSCYAIFGVPSLLLFPTSLSPYSRQLLSLGLLHLGRSRVEGLGDVHCVLEGRKGRTEEGE